MIWDFVSNSKKLLKNFKKEVEKDFGFILHFEVDDIDREYINDEVSDLYGEMEEALPEHTKYTFYHEDMGMFNIEDFSVIFDVADPAVIVICYKLIAIYCKFALD